MYSQLPTAASPMAVGINLDVPSSAEVQRLRTRALHLQNVADAMETRERQLALANAVEVGRLQSETERIVSWDGGETSDPEQWSKESEQVRLQEAEALKEQWVKESEQLQEAPSASTGEGCTEDGAQGSQTRWVGLRVVCFVNHLNRPLQLVGEGGGVDGSEWGVEEEEGEECLMRQVN